MVKARNFHWKLFYLLEVLLFLCSHINVAVFQYNIPLSENRYNNDNN